MRRADLLGDRVGGGAAGHAFGGVGVDQGLRGAAAQRQQRGGGQGGGAHDVAVAAPAKEGDALVAGQLAGMRQVFGLDVQAAGYAVRADQVGGVGVRSMAPGSRLAAQYTPEMDNPTTKFALDHWYKVLMAAGLLVLCLAGAGLLKEFPTAATALVALGTFFIGMGEWINHPLQTRVFARGIATSHPRRASAAGWFFDVLGLGLLVVGLYRFLR